MDPETAVHHEARIQELENELEAMTAALAQAWDQLVPFLQATPQQASSSQDIVPVLESILAAVDAEMGALHLTPENGEAEWFTIPPDVVALSALQQHLAGLSRHTQPLHVHQVPAWNGRPTHWLLMPIVVHEQTVGAIGVGLAEERREFNAFDARTLMRMTERAASQIVAASLAASKVREAKTAHQMQIAGLIQRSIQPASGPALPGLQVVAHWQPAASVGGDAWGWVLQPSGRLACFVLDVAGKGLPAALGAVSLHTALKMALRLDLSPVEALRTANDEFYEAYTDTNLFTTVTVITLDPASGTIEQANAGHPPTLLRQSGAWQRWAATAPPVGVLPNLPLTPQRATLHPGDMIVCYSDGLSEIEADGGLWGVTGLLEAIPPGAQDAGTLVEAVLNAADRVRGGRAAHDDQTLLALCFGDARPRGQGEPQGEQR